VLAARAAIAAAGCCARGNCCWLRVRQLLLAARAAIACSVSTVLKQHSNADIT
jgi:hypothetical protein